MITVIGIPVYFHYCGGQLEEINYVLKSNSCCDDDVAEDNGCCKDENYVLMSKIDFTIKDQNAYAFVKAVSELLYTNLFVTAPVEAEALPLTASDTGSPHPLLQQHLIVSTSVLRI